MMEAAADTTLWLTSSGVRESKEKVLGIVRSSLTGLLYTVDRLAVRVWRENKQVKALHFTELGTTNLEVIGWECMLGADGVVGLLQMVKPNGGNPLVASICRIWGPTLQVLCNVDFQDMKFSHFFSDARQETICIVESSSLRVRVLRLTTVRQQPDAPLFAKAAAVAVRHNPRVLAVDALLDAGSESAVRYKCDIKDHSSDAFVAPSGFATASFLRHNAIVFLSNTSIHLFSNEAVDGGSLDPTIGPGFTSINVFLYTDVWGEQHVVARPSCAQVYDNDKLIVGFRDGRIRVLLCVDGLSSERRPTLLFDFQCNSDMYPVSCFYTAPWSASGGGDGLALDLVTLGGDHILSHWRLHLRRKEYTATSGSNRSETVEKKRSQFLGYSHLLGEHVFRKASSSATSRTKIQKHCVVAFEDEFDMDSGHIVSADDPGLRKKRVVTTYDGLLHYFDVHEPHRTVLQTSQDVVHAVVRLEQRFYTYATLHTGELRLLSVPLPPKMHDDSIATSAGERSFVRTTKLNGVMGQPTVVYYASGNLDAVFVGYSSGNVQSFSCGDNYLAPLDGLVDTSIIHTTAIRKLLTVVAPRPLSIDQTPSSMPEQGGSRLLVLLVGDDQGILSTWRITEKCGTKHGSRPVDALRWAAHAHLGAIIHTVASATGDFAAEACNIVVTACNRGLVKCWVLQPTGKMALSAFFHSMPSLSSLVCLAVAAHSSPLDTSSSSSVYRGGHDGASKHIVRPAAVSLLCLCADSFGNVESRLLSNDPTKASHRPVRSMHVTNTSLTKMSIVANNVNDDRVQVCGETSLILCAAIDGTVAFLELDETGYFRRARAYFSMPFAPVNIVQFFGLLHFVGPVSIVEVRKFASSEDGGFGEHSFVGDSFAFEHDRYAIDGPGLLSTLSETSGSVIDEESYPDNASYAQSAHSKQVVLTQNIYAASSDRARFPSGIITKRRQLIANISATIPGVDVQSARKDRRLLDLFKRFDVDGRRFLSRANSIVLVKQWLGTISDHAGDGDISTPNTSADNSDPVILLFADPLFDDDEVQYLELSAVAAAARTALRRAVQVSSRRTLDYATMRMSKRAITYNIMGEKEESNTRELIDGVPLGQAGPARATLSRVTHKVQGREAVDIASSCPILLRALPHGLVSAVRHLELPANWSPARCACAPGARGRARRVGSCRSSPTL